MPTPSEVSDPIGEHLERGLVAVIDAGGEICGGGVLVDDRHVVTCAHVVNSACRRNQGEAVAPEGPVTIRFPYAGGGTVQAAVAAWRPPTGPVVTPPCSNSPPPFPRERRRPGSSVPPT